MCGHPLTFMSLPSEDGPSGAQNGEVKQLLVPAPSFTTGLHRCVMWKEKGSAVPGCSPQQVRRNLGRAPSDPSPHGSGYACGHSAGLATLPPLLLRLPCSVTGRPPRQQIIGQGCFGTEPLSPEELVFFAGSKVSMVSGRWLMDLSGLGPCWPGEVPCGDRGLARSAVEAALDVCVVLPRSG